MRGKRILTLEGDTRTFGGNTSQKVLLRSHHQEVVGHIAKTYETTVVLTVEVHLLELVVVGKMTVLGTVSILVLTLDSIRAQKSSLLVLQLLISCIVELLDDIHSVLSCDGCNCMQVADSRRHLLVVDLLLDDGLITVEQIVSGSTVVRTDCGKHLIVEVLTQLTEQISPYGFGNGHILQAFTLNDARAIDAFHNAVWVEALDSRTEIGLQNATNNLHIVIVTTSDVVRAELHVACQLANNLLIAHTGTECQERQNLIETIHRHNDEVLTVLDKTLCQALRCNLY